MKTIKKQFCITSLLTILMMIADTHSFADQLYHCKTPLLPKRCVTIDRSLIDGFYVGVGGGYDIYKVHEVSPAPVVSSNPNVDTRGVAGSVFGGYGQYYCWFYYAGEISATGSGASSTFEKVSGGIAYQGDVNVRVSYAASILAGTALSPETLLYFRLGAVRTSLNTDETITIAGVTTRTNTSEWADGVRFGVGIETGIFDQVSLRGEFSRTYYGTEDTKANTQFTTAQSQVMLSLVYHFCTF